MKESQRTIFIIDDCVEDRTAYRRYLESNTTGDRQYTCQIVESESAADAIKRCQHSMPDLILLDFMLPDATGLEFIEELKLSTGRKLLPIVMLTGYGNESVAVQAMKSGAQDYLVKAKVTSEALNRSCHTVMERVRLMQQLEHEQEQQRLIAAELYQNLQNLNTQLEVKVQERTLQLQQSERKYRAIFEQTFQFIGLLAPDGRILELNHACLEFFSKKYDAVIGKFFWEFFCCEIVPEVHRGLREAIAQTLHTHFVRYEARVPNGRCVLRTVDFSFKPILNNTGEVIWLLLEGRDVTERKQVEEDLSRLNQELEARVIGRTTDLEQANANLRSEIVQRQQVENELRQSEQKFRQLAENIREVFFVYNHDLSELIYISPAYEEMSGRSCLSLYQNPASWFEFVHPDDKHLVSQDVPTNINLEGSKHEYRIIQADGSICWICTRSFYVRDDAGEVQRVVGFAEDITERKQVELEILQNRDLREAIFNESTDAIFLVDPDTLLSIDCNRRAIELFEAESKEELIHIFGSTLHKDPFTPKQVDKILEEIKIQSFWSQEIEYVTHKGNFFWGHLASKQISVAGKVHRLIRISDISERKQTMERLQRSLEEKETLLKEIHHRVKNNLQIISSLLRMQSRRVQDQVTMILFQESQNRVQSMALIHEHLYQSPELSQIDFGGYIHSLMNNLLRSYGISQKTIALKIATHGIKLNLDIAIPCGLLINELISNSLKYAFPEDRGGEIIIRLVLSPNNTVTLTVSDSGIGIPETLDWQNTKSLGLRIVHNLTKQLKGNILLERDRGTTFHITFPRALKP